MIHDRTLNAAWHASTVADPEDGEVSLMDAGICLECARDDADLTLQAVRERGDDYDTAVRNSFMAGLEIGARAARIHDAAIRAKHPNLEGVTLRPTKRGAIWVLNGTPVDSPREGESLGDWRLRVDPDATGPETTAP